MPSDKRGEEIDLHGVLPLLDSIVKHWRPSQIWLFGSRARGDASPTSDWDLFVVGPTPEPSYLEVWRVRRESGVRADIAVWSTTDFLEYQSIPNTLAYEVAQHGVLLYGGEWYGGCIA